MRGSLLKGAVVAMAVAPLAQAGAVLFDFSYTLEGGQVLSGQLDGTVDGTDPNLVIVASISNPVFDGAPGPALPFILSVTDFFLANGALPTVSFDGTAMDLIACTDGGCSDGFAFDTSGIFGAPTYSSGSSFGDTFEAYNPSAWSLTPIPLPAALPLMVGALAVAGFAARRRAA